MKPSKTCRIFCHLLASGRLRPSSFHAAAAAVDQHATPKIGSFEFTGDISQGSALHFEICNSHNLRCCLPDSSTGKHREKPQPQDKTVPTGLFLLRQFSKQGPSCMAIAEKERVWGSSLIGHRSAVYSSSPLNAKIFGTRYLLY